MKVNQDVNPELLRWAKEARDFIKTIAEAPPADDMDGSPDAAIQFFNDWPAPSILDTKRFQ